jgi:tetratricopeptide (TPR) repeat protein
MLKQYLPRNRQQDPLLSWRKFIFVCVLVTLIGPFSVKTVIAQNPPISDVEAKPLLEAFADIDAKQYKDAEKKLRTLTKSSNPYLATMAFEGLAHLYGKTQEFSKSVDAYEGAISKGVAPVGQINSYHQHAGQAAVMAGKYKVAVHHLEQWYTSIVNLQSPPSEAYALLSYLAIAQAETGQFLEAEATIDKAVASVNTPSSGLIAIQSAIREAASSPKRFKSGSIAALVRK